MTLPQTEHLTSGEAIESDSCASSTKKVDRSAEDPVTVTFVTPSISERRSWNVSKVSKSPVGVSMRARSCLRVVEPTVDELEVGKPADSSESMARSTTRAIFR